MPIMTRPVYLQTRQNLRMAVAGIQTLDLDSMSATLAQAVSDGNAKSHNMWAEGLASLQRDQALVALAQAFAKEAKP
jgi:hypothetical protein